MQKAAEPFFMKGRRTGLNPRFEWSPEQNEGSEGWGSDGTVSLLPVTTLVADDERYSSYNDYSFVFGQDRNPRSDQPCRC